uniref:DUF5672 domain-containing protein n=1 Tax=Phaeomonas parva TaxID=124430 RepID=A0A7S1TVV4_9STRA|mmetsp:Transcript_19480/g.58877  ORF Transcript_19480/g.58877 Transcript_19480/m.58877 type:complete len:384 (+) Transcript_19480:144-1295(+)
MRATRGLGLRLAKRSRVLKLSATCLIFALAAFVYFTGVLEERDAEVAGVAAALGEVESTGVMKGIEDEPGGDTAPPADARRDCRVEAVFIDGRESEAALAVLTSVLEFVPQVCITVYLGHRTMLPWGLKLRDDVYEAGRQLLGGAQPVDFRVEVLHRKFLIRGEKVQVGHLLSHPWFWDETNRSGEFVLTVQTDTVLCQKLDINAYDGYAYIGAPWAKNVACALPEKIADWQKVATDRGEAGPLDAERAGCVYVGNGGLSLRRNDWMRRALAVCPFTQWAEEVGGELGVEPSSFKCLATKYLEDQWFATILYSLGAPMPSKEDAYRFSIEQPWPIVNLDGMTEDEIKTLVPVGVHKTWNYAGEEVVQHLRNVCKYFDAIHPPK